MQGSPASRSIWPMISLYRLVHAWRWTGTAAVAVEWICSVYIYTGPINSTYYHGSLHMYTPTWGILFCLVPTTARPYLLAGHWCERRGTRAGILLKPIWRLALYWSMYICPSRSVCLRGRSARPERSIGD
jgi:hypothetical protein